MKTPHRGILTLAAAEANNPQFLRLSYTVVPIGDPVRYRGLLRGGSAGCELQLVARRTAGLLARAA